MDVVPCRNNHVYTCTEGHVWWRGVIVFRLCGEGGGGARRDAALIAKVEQLIAVNQQILAKSPVIEMGGNEVGQGINTAEREIQ